MIASAPYCGEAPLPADWLARWNFDPLLIVGLVGLFVLARLRGARLVPLSAAIAVLAVLFVSPLCALSSALFSMRVTHHVALAALAAPLVASALPLTRRSIFAWTLGHAAVFWAWHLPSAYAFALASDTAYWLMQATLLGSAIAFWQAVRAAPPQSAVAALLATMVQMGMLGALLTFSGTPLYPWHWATTQAWGLSPIEDQQLAGLVMWVPGAGVYLVAALRLMAGWLDARQRALAA